MNCPFCDVERLKEQGILLYEGKAVFVILSNPRLVPGHLLVIPKRHLLNIAELDVDERAEIFELLVKFEKKILEKGAATGCDIRQNYRPFMQQSQLKVDHIHFHLIPRSLDDELYQNVYKFQTAMFTPLSNEEKDRIFKLYSSEKPQ